MAVGLREPTDAYRSLISWASVCRFLISTTERRIAYADFKCDCAIMKDGNCEFLSGAALSDRIRSICAGNDVRCAVAFWGGGTAASLFPLGPDSATVICDISMGGTSKTALAELGGPGRAGLLVSDGMHAKIYISDRGAVVGSANASRNGIGHVSGESGRLLEAAIFCPVGTAAFDQAVSAVSHLMKGAKVVDDDDISRAPQRSKELGHLGQAADPASMSLLYMIVNAPHDYSNVSFAVVTEDDLDEDKAGAVRDEFLTSAKSEGFSSTLGEAFVQDNGDGSITSLLRNVIMFDLSASGNVVGNFHVLTGVVVLPSRRPEFAYGSAGRNKTAGKLRQLVLRRKLSNGDLLILQKVAEQNPSTWAFTSFEFADALSKAGLNGFQ